MTQLFFYFLIFCELAILALLIWAIITKVKSILKTYFLTPND